MSYLQTQSALEQIRQLIADETGQALSARAQANLEQILARGKKTAAIKTGAKDFHSHEVSILLADLRGFTAVSEKYPVSVVLEILNHYFSSMSRIVLEHGGTIDKFMGDSIMVLFGAPIAHEDDVERALACAVRMQIAIDKTNARHRAQELPELFMGIGINTGSVMAGHLGSELYSEYTVIGDEVNLASRIEAFSLRGQVLISQNTYQRCRDLIEAGPPEMVHVKGKAKPVVLVEVQGIPSLGLQVPRQEIRRSPRVEVHIPFSFQIIGDNKALADTVHTGTLLDLSYHGALAEVDRVLEPHCDIKLDVDLSLIGYKAHDIYAKVLKVTEADGRCQAGIEFTSASVQTDVNIHQFIQLLIQGSEVR